MRLTWTLPMRAARRLFVTEPRRYLLRKRLRGILGAAQDLEPLPKRMLVIAPHPDDEVLAVGGLIALARAAGCEVSVLLLTRGECSHCGCCTTPPSVIGLERRKLADHANAILGVESGLISCAELPDRNIPGPSAAAFAGAANELSGLVAKCAPQWVVYPHPLDTHADHAAAAHLCQEAIRLAGLRCLELHYLVWGWYRLPTSDLMRLDAAQARRVDVSAVSHLKRAAILAYFEIHPPACRHSWSGPAPGGFLTPFKTNHELLFVQSTLRARQQ